MQRINYIDAIRGFSIVLVVIGHVIGFSLELYNNSINYIFNIFTMPIFFFISGYFVHIKYRKTPFNFLKDKTIKLIIPTIIFFTLFCTYIDSNPFDSIQYGFGRYWFTIVLFEFLFIYYSISMFLGYKLIQNIGLIIISIIGIMILAIHRGSGQIWDILCLENVCKYFQFFTLGILCKKYNNQFIKLITKDSFRAIVIAIFIISLIIYFNESIKNNYVLVYKAIHDIIIRYAALLIIFILFFHNRNIFDSNNKLNKGLIFIGKRTLDIYLLHYFFIPDLTFLKPYIEPTNMMVIQLAISLTISSLIIGFCLFVSNIIRTSNILGFYLFGAKIKN